MIDVVVHAELAADNLRYASGGPHLASKAKGFRSSGQQQRQLGELLGGQSRWRTRRWPMPQTSDAALPTAAHPLTDCALRHAQRGGDVTLSPTLLFQFPGAQPSPLPPVRVRTHPLSLRHAPSPAFLAPALAFCPESFKHSLLVISYDEATRIQHGGLARSGRNSMDQLKLGLDVRICLAESCAARPTILA